MPDLTALNWIASALIAFTLVKLITATVSLPAWFRFARTVYVKPRVTSVGAVVLAGLVLWALLDAGVTIIPILAVIAFVMLLLVAGLAPFGTELIAWAEGRSLKDWLRGQWASSLIWLSLMGWGAYALLF
ncbi:MAG TPA: hypothetical protein EYQ81_00655 [Sneathiellales bacterium]|nr:hypothetical protein [Sneathiellales bacterium]